MNAAVLSALMLRGHDVLGQVLLTARDMGISTETAWVSCSGQLRASLRIWDPAERRLLAAAVIHDVKTTILPGAAGQPWLEHIEGQHQQSLDVVVHLYGPTDRPVPVPILRPITQEPAA